MIWPRNISANHSVASPVDLHTFLDWLETGPLFNSPAEQALITAYAFVNVFLTSAMNGVFIGVVSRYAEFHTPYFVILVCQAVYDVIPCLVMGISVLYLALSGSNPYQGSYWRCLLHRVFSITPFLAHIHNLCLLSVERVVFFYQPFLHLREVTIARVLVTEAVIVAIALTFNTVSTAVGHIFFSTAGFICSNASKPWVWTVQLCFYYVPSVVLVASTITSLYVLALKQSRKIADQQRRHTSGAGHNSPSATDKRCRATDEAPTVTAGAPARSDVISATRTSRVGGNYRRKVDSPTATAANSGSLDQWLRSKSSSVRIKRALKLIVSTCGVFWITLVPSIIGLDLMLSKVSLHDLDMDSAMRYRTLYRVFIFVPTLAWIADPFIYLYVNPPLRLRFSNVITVGLKVRVTPGST